jgi:hypothetical protein
MKVSGLSENNRTHIVIYNAPNALYLPLIKHEGQDV